MIVLAATDINWRALDCVRENEFGKAVLLRRTIPGRACAALSQVLQPEVLLSDASRQVDLNGEGMGDIASSASRTVRIHCLQSKAAGHGVYPEPSQLARVGRRGGSPLDSTRMYPRASWGVGPTNKHSLPEDKFDGVGSQGENSRINPQAEDLEREAGELCSAMSHTRHILPSPFSRRPRSSLLR